MSSSPANCPPASTIADVYSGVLAPDEGREFADFRLVGRPYIETERRSDGRRGNRDWTAEGRIEYSIEGSFVRGIKSAERCLLCSCPGRGWLWCVISVDRNANVSA